MSVFGDSHRIERMQMFERFIGISRFERFECDQEMRVAKSEIERIVAIEMMRSNQEECSV